MTDSTETVAPESPASEQSSGRPRTALVVEDSKLIRRTLCVLLKNRGIHVMEAEHGKAALNQILTVGVDGIDIIFLDMMMPEMDGLAFMLAARERYGDKLPPVVACSAVADKRVIQEVAPLGIAGYVLKPFKNEMIYRKLDTLLPQTEDGA